MRDLEYMLKRGLKILKKAQVNDNEFLYNESIKIFMEIINLNNTSFLPYFGIGIAMNKIGKYEDSIKAYTQSFQTKDKIPNSTKSLIYSSRGLSYYNLGKKEKSQIDYENAIKLDNNNYLAHLHLGMIKGNSKFYLSAIDHFKKSLNSKNKKIINSSKENIEITNKNMGFFLKNYSHESLKIKSQKINLN